MIQDTETYEISFSHQISIYKTHSSWKNLYNPTILNFQQLYKYTTWILVAKTE